MRFISLWISPVLFFLFLIVDFFNLPHKMWECVAIRSLILPVCFLTHKYLDSQRTYKQRQVASVLFTLANAGIIELLIRLAGGYSSNYFSGIILVLISSITFMPFERFYTFLNASLVLLLHNLICLSVFDFGHQDIASAITGNFFLVGTVALSLITRHYFHEYQLKSFQDNLRMLEANQTLASLNLELEENKSILQKNLIDREKIILEKTEENLNLSFLKSHFSPQVIHVIKGKGLGKLDSALVCIMFVDIVNSTQQQEVIPKDVFAKIVGDFIDEVSFILKKHNITVDKFLGDGVLAYSNHPLKRTDYIESMCLSALEVKDFYSRNELRMKSLWGTDFAIRIGIDVGDVTVGSFGKLHQHYTIIGKAVNRSQRTCASAGANQILLSNDVHKNMNKALFATSFATKAKFKGVKDPVDLYELKSHHTQMGTGDTCPDCGGSLVMAYNAQRILVQKCQVCGYEEE